MGILRRRLSWLICAWLGVQLAGAVAAPLALCCQNAEAADSVPNCCKGMAPGQQCPMHRAHQDDRTCKMRSACGPSDAALVTLAGGVGVLPSSTIRVTAFDPGDIVHAAAPAAILRTDRPESPRPRS